MNRANPIPLAALLLLSGCVEATEPTVRLAPETETQGSEQSAQVTEAEPQPEPEPEAEPEPEVEVGQAPPAGDIPASAQQGVAWLIAHQHESGAWGQGDEAPSMGRSAGAQTGAGSVADTCMASIALLRSGSTPASGPHRQNVARAASWVMDNIEGSDDDSMWITEVRGTRVQSKIGQYVDTFAALNLLNELRGHMGSDAGEARVTRNIERIVHKLENNQATDGTWAQGGWAPTLGQSLATRGLNRAAQGGASVDQRVLDRATSNARRRVDTRGRAFRAPAPGSRRRSAGVDLYDAAEAASTLMENAETESRKGGGPGKQSTPRAARAQAEATAAYEALSARLEDPSFVRGFGSNGGEEFLSYLLISETMRARGGERWTQWHTQISDLLGGVQNGDGSWTGHHCITGRTFCTAMAVMVLLSDRAPATA